jgi:RNA polymerase sigma factor (sigma-70 family)
MSGGQLDSVLRHLRKLVGTSADEDSDGRLLERFLARRDEAAFATLLARHGPMVWGVCRRLLPEAHDAEDAFQATFLVLVRRARSLDRRGSLAGWLHAVAGRVALRARAGHGRQQPLTEEVSAMNATDPPSEAARRELRALIDEELRRLPEKYRGPVLLCDVQGRSHDEAARQLGYPAGSMSWRLARGRELLRRGLERRGVALAAGALAALLAEDATAAVPAAVTEATTRAVLLVAAGAGTLPAQLAALVDGTARALAVARLKLLAALLALGLLVAAGGVAAQRALTAGRAPSPQPEQRAENVEPAPPPAPPVKDTPNKSEPAPAPPVAKPPPRVDLHGDPLPPGAVTRLGTLRLRQADGVSAFAFSPDGKLLATAGDLKVGPLDKTLRATAGDSTDGWLHVWDVATGKLVSRLREGGVTQVAFSPDGKTLVVGTQPGGQESHRYRLWDLETGRERLGLGQLDRPTSALAFSPDGKILFACEEFIVSTWDTTTGAPGKTYAETARPISAFALSRDGKSLAVITDAGDKVVLVGTTRPTRLEFARKGRLFNAIAFSPDGKRVAAAAAYEPPVFFDTETMKEFPTAEAPEVDSAREIVFRPDGKELLTLDRTGEVRAWDGATGKYLGRRAAPTGRASATLSPDGKHMAYVYRLDRSDRTTLRVFDLARGQVCLRFGGHEGSVNSVAFSPDGKALASAGADGVTVLWDLRTARELWRVAVPDERTAAMAFAPSGKLVAATGPSGYVELFDSATGKSLKALGRETEYCRSLAFSGDGSTLAVGGLSRPLSFWAVDDLQLQARSMIDLKAYEVAIDRAGRYAVVAAEGVFVGNLSGNDRPHRLELGGSFSAISLALAPEGGSLALVPWREGLVRVVDTVREKQPWHIPGGGSQARSAALSSGGRILAVGDTEGSVRLFDAAGTELVRLAGHEGPVLALAFSADGTLLASAGADTTVLVWDLARVFRDARQPAPLSPVELAALWDDLDSQDNTFTRRAAAVLASDPRGALTLLKERLKPAPPGDEERLRRAIADIQNDDPKVRDAAMKELRRFGPEAIPPLRELQRTATDSKLQARLRAFLTLAELNGVTPASAEWPREVVAVQALEMIGTPEARQLLEEVAKGAPSARLTEAARAALRRMER